MDEAPRMRADCRSFEVFENQLHLGSGRVGVNVFILMAQGGGMTMMRRKSPHLGSGAQIPSEYPRADRRYMFFL